MISYFNGCGLYCAASGGKTIRELGDCIHDEAGLGSYADVFCNAVDNATATANPTNGDDDLPAEASASVVVSGGDGDDDRDDGEDGEDGDEGGKDEDKGSAATRSMDLGGNTMSKAGLMITALLVSAVAVGALQI